MIDGPRTNNNLEGWHSRVKKTLAGKAHWNIFEMVELFIIASYRSQHSPAFLAYCRKNSEK